MHYAASLSFTSQLCLGSCCVSTEAAKVPPLNIPGLVAVEAIEEGEERVELLNGQLSTEWCIWHRNFSHLD